MATKKGGNLFPWGERRPPTHNRQWWESRGGRGKGSLLKDDARRNGKLSSDERWFCGIFWEDDK